jgi:hypothetical protein
MGNNERNYMSLEPEDLRGVQALTKIRQESLEKIVFAVLN